MFTRLSSADDCKSILCCPVMAVDLFWKLDARAKLVHSYVSQQMADTFENDKRVFNDLLRLL